MTLSTLIQNGGLAKVATATVATTATWGPAEAGTVAEVAGVAVAAVPSQLGDLPTTNPYVTELRDQLRQARNWVALYAILDEAQTAYDAGEVTREEVESLTGYAADWSSKVAEHAEGERISDLLARQPVVRVRSRLLGEVLVWVADAVEITEEIAEVVYRESELRRLVGRSPAELRAVHEVKRALDGEVI